MYAPSPELVHPFVTEQLVVGDEAVNLVVVNEHQPNAILYFGGNGESVVNNGPQFADIFPSHTVYLVNYRGYGGSGGEPTEASIYNDAQHAYDMIKARHTSVSVIGRSLGTGVATYLAATRHIDKMVLVTPYDSILNVAQARFPWYPMSLLLKDKYESVERVKDIKSPTLVILAENDVVISPEHSKRLIQAFPPSQIVVETIERAGHNNLSNTHRYYELLKRFI